MVLELRKTLLCTSGKPVTNIGKVENAQIYPGSVISPRWTHYGQSYTFSVAVFITGCLLITVETELGTDFLFISCSLTFPLGTEWRDVRRDATFLHLYNQSLVFVNLGEANSSTDLWYYRNIIACRNRGEVKILTRGHQSRSAGPFRWYDGI